MFRRAYTRGVMAALVKTGSVKIASEEMAAEVADAVAENMDVNPTEGLAPDATANVAAQLVDVSNKLQEAAMGVAGAANTVAEETVSKKAAAWLKRKLGMETATVMGDNPMQKNTQEMGAQVSGEGMVDNKDRPAGYANVGEDGVGTQEDAGEGAVGTEKKHVAPGTEPAAPNSAVEASKQAEELRSFLRKAAMESATLGAKKNPNSQEMGAQVSGEGMVDNKDRPAGYANKGEDAVGKSDMAAKARAAAVGAEEPHPAQEGSEGATSNTAIEQSKKAEDAYLNEFKKVSQAFLPMLPKNVEDSVKVAAVQYLMGLSPSQRNKVAEEMSKKMPEGLREYMEEKKDEEKKDEEKKDEEKKDEEKKDEEKKTAASLIEQLRALQA